MRPEIARVVAALQRRELWKLSGSWLVVEIGRGTHLLAVHSDTGNVYPYGKDLRIVLFQDERRAILAEVSLTTAAINRRRQEEHMTDLDEALTKLEAVCARV